MKEEEKINDIIDEEEPFCNLIEELSDNRKDLHGIVKDVEKLRNQLGSVLPANIDFRNRYILENKIKTIAAVISSELQVRKQIDDNIKLEVDLRSKTGEGDISPEKRQSDIRELADALETIERENKKRREEKEQEEEKVVELDLKKVENL